MSTLAHNLLHLCSGRPKQTCLQGVETNMTSMLYPRNERNWSADFFQDQITSDVTSEGAVKPVAGVIML